MSSPVSDRPRRLCAILHADLTGYARLMEGAEECTVRHLKSVHAEIWRPAVEEAGGRIVNIVGDSVLAEFGSAVAAVAAAVDLQERMARFNEAVDEEQRFMFRIGLHLGEVIVDESDTIFGDAVNVAARIQLMAEPGGIAASSAIREATHLQVDHTFVDGGRHHAKNISRTLRIYHLRTTGSTSRLPRGAFGNSLLWGAAAVASVLLVGGYLVLAVDPMTSVNIAARHLSAEQLEQALAERRTADTLMSEKRALEAQAARSVETEAEAGRQAGAELEKAREARQKAERELAQLKEDIEARRSAGQAESRRSDQQAVEEAARRKIEAEAAALRDAEERLARKAAADTAAKRQVRREHAEASTISLKEPVAAVATVARAPALPAVVTQGLADGVWRGTYECGRNGNFLPLLLKPEVRLRGGSGAWYTTSASPANDHMIGLSISTDGARVRVTRQSVLSWADAGTALSGSVDGNVIRASNGVCSLVLTREATPPAEQRGSPSLPSADGSWRGTYECGRNHNYMRFSLEPEMQVRGGTGTWYAAKSSPVNDHTIGIDVSVDGSNVRVKRQSILSHTSTHATMAVLSGSFDGDTIRASNGACAMVLTRVLSKPS